ncbi:MAG: hypothetical protein E5X54_31555, partial [Mesorhizobium sp.]
APHLPAGILSPYRDGERGRCHRRFRQAPALQEGRQRCGKPFLPVTLRGELPGRAMRGGANFGKHRSPPQVGNRHSSEAIALARVWKKNSVA